MKVNPYIVGVKVKRPSFARVRNPDEEIETIETQAEPVRVPGKELLPFSAGELERQLRDEVLSKIADAQRRLEEQKRQRRIADHYYEVADKLMNSLWKECYKRTGHFDVGSDETSNGQRCNSCLAPLVRDHGRLVVSKERSKFGIQKVASELRSADKQAGIEWIP